jgi:hypothetical protein
VFNQQLFVIKEKQMKLEGCAINEQFKAEVEMLMTTAAQVILARKLNVEPRTKDVALKELANKFPAKQQEKAKV